MGNSSSKPSSSSAKRTTSTARTKTKSRKSSTSASRIDQNSLKSSTKSVRPSLSTRNTHSESDVNARTRHNSDKTESEGPPLLGNHHGSFSQTHENVPNPLTNELKKEQPTNNIQRLHRRSHSTHEVISNHNNIPNIKVSDSDDMLPESNVSSNNISNSTNTKSPNAKSRSSLMNRRSSFNTTVDLPPSMIQVAPKSPILKNSKYSASAASFQQYEDTSADEENLDHHSHHTHSHHNHGHRNHQHNGSQTNFSTKINGSSLLGTSSPLSRPTSHTSHTGNHNTDDDHYHHSNSSSNDVSSQIPYPNSRSNSFTSSHRSRKSSFGSNNTTAYSTPLNSPGMKRLMEHHNKAEVETGDYFGVVNDNFINEYVSTGDTPTIVNDGSSPLRQTHLMNLSNNHNDVLNSAKDMYPSNNLVKKDSTFANSTDNDINDSSINNDGYSNKSNNSISDSAANFVSNLTNDNIGTIKKKKPIKPIDIDVTIQKLLDAGYASKRTKNVCLKNSEITQICNLARDIFSSQPSLLELSPPVKIVGDVHGQYGDLLRLFTKCGFPPSSNYLFLGDYVDRGKQSLETILLLLCYKIKYPENFFLLRGNHECANVTRVYGFYDECKRRCSIKIWKTFIDTFNTLPLAAIVAGKIFCVHGGLSPVLNSMDEIRHVSRPTDVPDFGLISDLLWSDPTDSPNEWEDNERGVSYCYNKVAINKFLNRFGFDLVCRAHMVVEDGYEFFNDRSLVTVFSAPNYCGEFDNWGAVMSVSEGLLCSFELLDPLDSAALKQVMKKGRQERKLANQQQIQEV